MLPGVLEPGGEVVEGVPPRDVVHQESPRGAPVVGASDGPERLLTRLRAGTSRHGDILNRGYSIKTQISQYIGGLVKGKSAL